MPFSLLKLCILYVHIANLKFAVISSMSNLHICWHSQNVSKMLPNLRTFLRCWVFIGCLAESVGFVLGSLTCHLKTIPVFFKCNGSILILKYSRYCDEMLEKLKDA